MPIQVKGTRAPDVFVATALAEAFDGSFNYDKITYEGSAAGLTIDLASLANNTGDAAGDSYVDIEMFVLTMKNDRFIGSAGKETVNGRNGDDFLSTGDGDDVVLGDYGRDTLEGGNGNDGIWGGSLEDLIVGGAGNDFLAGDSHNDTVNGGDGNDSMDGGTGIDLATYAGASAGVTVSLAVTTAQATGGSGSDVLSNFENLDGSAFNDRLYGNAGANVIGGGAGDDVLAGGGVDTLDGGTGLDQVSFADSATAVTITIADSGSQTFGSLRLVSIEGVEGSSRSDTITGSRGANLICGLGDQGTVQMVATNEKFYKYSDTILIPFAQIDNVGEWVVVPKRIAIEDQGHLVSIDRSQGDTIFAVTNGFNDARDWNAIVSGRAGAMNIGPGGEIGADSTVIFNAGPGQGNVTVSFNGATSEAGFPGPKAAGNNKNGVVNVTTYSAGTVTAGDVLTGGAGADTFRYVPGHGVDRITDFVKGTDRIDLDANWFDGNAANGEVVATSVSGGTLIQFSDTSADKVVDNSAILVSSLAIGAYDTSIFV